MAAFWRSFRNSKTTRNYKRLYRKWGWCSRLCRYLYRRGRSYRKSPLRNEPTRKISNSYTYKTCSRFISYTTTGDNGMRNKISYRKILTKIAKSTIRSRPISPMGLCYRYIQDINSYSHRTAKGRKNIRTMNHEFIFRVYSNSRNRVWICTPYYTKSVQYHRP